MSKHFSFDIPSRNLSHFRGTWALRREIWSGHEFDGIFSGIAKFTNDRTMNLQYVEEGILHLTSSPSMIGRRSYVWTPSLDVYFVTGEFFHKIPAHGGNVTYLCPPDTYSGQYEFTNWPKWSLKWSINGPKKNYELVTFYQPT